MHCTQKYPVPWAEQECSSYSEMGIYASDDFLLLKTAPFLCGLHGDGKCPPGNVLLSFHLLRLGFKDFLLIIARGLWPLFHAEAHTWFFYWVLAGGSADNSLGCGVSSTRQPTLRDAEGRRKQLQEAFLLMPNKEVHIPGWFWDKIWLTVGSIVCNY